MRELRDILREFEALRGRREAAVLASVVLVEGSTYRRPGARSLLLENGRTLGLISGGCLESDLIENAARVRETGEPCLVHYDSSSAEDIIWGLGLGCAGMVDVLLERVDADAPGPLAFLSECLAAGRRGALATLLSADVADAPPPGTRWMLASGGAVEGSESTSPVGRVALAALEAAAAGAPRGVVRRELAGGACELAIEVMPRPTRLLLCGAGPDAGPVARLARELGWDVQVIDWRPALARPEAFPGADVVLVDPEQAAREIELDADTVALVMTHHYLNDKALVRWLLPSPVRYLGLLGPKQRSDDLLRDLRDEGDAPSDEALERLHAPAGLDLGADAPEEIALALVSEIQAVLAGRSGGWLRNRKGPIHDPPSSP